MNLDRGGFGQGYEFTWLREIALLNHKREKNTDGAAPPNTSRHHSGNITELFNNIGTRLHDDPQVLCAHDNKCNHHDLF